MSFRASFVSEYIYDDDDYEKLKNELSKDNGKFFCLFEPMICEGTEIPIIAGKVYDHMPYEHIELQDRLEEIELRDPVKFVVMRESSAPVLLEKIPGEEIKVSDLYANAHENTHGD